MSKVRSKQQQKEKKNAMDDKTKVLHSKSNSDIKEELLEQDVTEKESDLTLEQE
jgi:hypothetical protein